MYLAVGKLTIDPNSLDRSEGYAGKSNSFWGLIGNFRIKGHIRKP
jgi:hypothetical protein